jgi:hypothetical protein
MEGPAQKRQEYLRKILALRANMLFWGMSAITFCLFVFLFVMAYWFLNDEQARPDVRILCAGMAVLAAIAFVSFRSWRRSKHEAETIAYVPPVREQIAALPAEEILVRGSDQPAATPDELLRPARERAETGAEELLRADQEIP